jgi:hypothetical protein
MNTPKWLIAIVLVLALSMPASPVNAQSPATSVTLTLPTPHPGVVGADLSFTLMLDVANIVPGVAGIDVYFTYDPTYVVPNPGPIPVVEPLQDFFGPSIVTSYGLLPPADPKCPAPPPGFPPLPCIHLAAAGPAQVTRSGAVARFHFIGTADTPPGVTTCFGDGFDITMVDSNGFPVIGDPEPPDPQCTPIVDSDVEGRVLRQGTPAAPPNLGGGTLACSQVDLLSGGLVTLGPIFTDVPGAFSLTVPPPSGAQTVRAVYPGYLTSQKSITISGGGPINVGTTTLRGGDVNGDNKINILDVGIIIGNFGAGAVPVESSLPAICPLPLAGSLDPVDINDDGNINISDLAIIAGANFGLVGPTPWQ